MVGSKTFGQVQIRFSFTDFHNLDQTKLNWECPKWLVLNQNELDCPQGISDLGSGKVRQGCKIFQPGKVYGRKSGMENTSGQSYKENVPRRQMWLSIKLELSGKNKSEWK